ncbi:MAG: hypothetical protein GY747_01555 [Planctomycetes bacterium]|nr:hypothetical protein [Planctomycetota bacterium]MCP4769914.1 hypothetical protein [Planctomycetota bacterium]MCP4859754.1 hypothetical protein [Planctomycetota bacterium]
MNGSTYQAPPTWRVIVLIALLQFSYWQIQQDSHTEMNAGLEAYATEDYQPAKQHFENALAQQSSPEALRNLALACLKSRDLDRAAQVADQIASSGNRNDLAWRDFFLGNLAWRRSELAEFEAHGPVPPAGALERAIAHTEAALQAWQAALETRDEWPEALRNTQRADYRLALLREEQQANAGNADPNVEKMNGPPDLNAAPMDPAEQERLMQQLDRLDLQEAARKAEQKLDLSGALEW